MSTGPATCCRFLKQTVRFNQVSIFVSSHMYSEINRQRRSRNSEIRTVRSTAFFADSRVKANSTRFYGLQGFHTEECSFWLNREMWTCEPLSLPHTVRILLCCLLISPICIPFFTNIKIFPCEKSLKCLSDICASVPDERCSVPQCTWGKETIPSGVSPCAVCMCVCHRDNLCEVESGNEQPLFVWSSLWQSITRNSPHYDECLIGS